MPFLEDEGPVADEVARSRPVTAALEGIAVLFQRGAVHREHAVVVEQLQEVGCGVVQGHPQGVFIEHFDADFIEVIDLPGGEGLGIADREIHVGVKIAEARGQCPLPRPGEVAGGHRVAVRPAGVGAQVEGVHQAVGTDFPALGDARDDLQGGRILEHQAFEQGDDDVVLGHAGDDMGIELLRLGTIAPVQHLLAVARLDAAFAAAAGGQCDGAAQAQHEQGANLAETHRGPAPILWRGW